MRPLSELAQGRDNNLNLLRMLAAVAVLVSHAVPIALGPDPAEPLEWLLGESLGTLAVMIFFVISGFLITQSFERTESRQRFIWARVLRIMPGHIVCLLFVALLLGPAVTDLSTLGYITDPQTLLFVIRNALLVPLVYTLPGVFEGLPTDAVVGSIWTLRYEVGCYIMVFCLGVLGLYRSSAVFKTIGVIWVIGLWPALLWVDNWPHPLIENFARLSVPFWIGMLFYAFRAQLTFRPTMVMVTLALALLLGDSLWAFSALSLAAGYLTFWLAYLPSGVLRHYNRLGDYSYGVYIYAFPIQGWAVWAFGPQTAWENVLYALPPTLLLAVASWHLVERPSLKLINSRLVRPPVPQGSNA